MRLLKRVPARAGRVADQEPGAELAMKNRILTMAPSREFAEAGGLMSYGQKPVDS